MEEPAPRMFWPKDVWSKCAVQAQAPSSLIHSPSVRRYGKTLADFKVCASPALKPVPPLTMLAGAGEQHASSLLPEPLGEQRDDARHR